MMGVFPLFFGGILFRGGQTVSYVLIETVGKILDISVYFVLWNICDMCLYGSFKHLS